MTLRVLLLAHGRTLATRRATFANGESLEAGALDDGLALRCDLALSSPAPAALETAAGLARDVIVDVALRDLDVGTWAGRSLAEIARSDPSGAAAFVADPDFASHGGESVNGFVGRVDAWMEARRSERGRLVAVTHVGVIRAAVISTLGAPASAFWHIDVAPLHGVTFSSDGRRWTLRATSVNDRK